MGKRGILVGMAIAFLSSAGLAPAADGPGTDRVPELLRAAKDQALVLKSDMETMGFFAGSEYGWGSHASIVNVYKDHIKTLREQATKLSDERTVATPLQKTTIDRIGPLLQELASEVDGVIQRINRDPKRLNGEEYKSYFQMNADLAGELAGLVRDYVDYGNTRQELEQLAGRLGP